MRIKYFLFLLPFILVTSCSNKTLETNPLDVKMNKIAEDYVKVILNIGQYDPSYVDAYYGPVEWKPKEQNLKPDTAAYSKIDSKIDELLNKLEALNFEKGDKLQKLRLQFLYKQLLAAKTKIYMLSGISFNFDDEAKHLYDVKLEHKNLNFYNSYIDELNKLLPGSGPLSEKIDNFKNQFIIPKEKLDIVFKTAIQECRKRTLAHITLPANEKFDIEYVTDKPWAGYNWYKGNNYSVIQVNTSLPIYVDRVIDLAAHEGYPGHHVYNSLLETNLSKGKNWVEFTVYPLFSPQSLIAEGSANFGIEMVFPGEERVNYEKSVIFPLAGLNADKADLYYKIQDLLAKLSYAGNDISASYLNGEKSKEQTIKSLMDMLFMTRSKAEQRIRFLDVYRSYIINYNVGQDLVKNYVESNGGDVKNIKKRWEIFSELLSSPMTPSYLTKNIK